MQTALDRGSPHDHGHHSADTEGPVSPLPGALAAGELWPETVPGAPHRAQGVIRAR